MKRNQILLTFADKATADYVKLVCRRKGTGLESYIVDNFEWDDMPACLDGVTEVYNWKDCKVCDHSDRCPDVKKKESRNGAA
jgi:hypothetical protein